MTILIEAKDVSVKIGEHLAAEKLNFKIPAGSFVSILGPNGAGKSVLVKTLLGLNEIAGGRILIFGDSPKRFRPDLIGYVPQIKNFDRSFPARAVDLVVSGLRHNWPFRLNESLRAKARKALKAVHAEHLFDRQLSTLSGGELQKIYLARALIQKRKLIVLDEPATGIDSIGEADLYGILHHVQKESATSIIMVTHDLAVANHHSDYVLLLNRLQIAFGPPSEVLKEDYLNRAFGHSAHTHEHGGVHV